jgi:transcriptional regulator with XRE-family HTH domain
VSKKNQQTILTQPCVKFVFLKKNDTMKNSKSIRAQFGLSQNDLSIYLLINRSQLTMYEQGKRDLPAHALVKLAEMELFLVNYKAQLPNKSIPFEAEQLLEATKIVAKYQKEFAYQQLVLQRELAMAQARYKNNLHLFEFLTAQEEEKKNENTMVKNWITAMKTISQRNINAYGLQHQTKIKLKIQKNLPPNPTDIIDSLRIR